MRLKIFTLLLFPIISYSQINTSLISQQEFSKETAQFQAKKFIFKNILKVENQTVKFEVDPLSAAQSGELTTLYYNCEEQKKEGLILSFYGDYWNEAGVKFQGYAFKHFEKKDAVEFLTKIQSAIDANEKYIKDDSNNNIVLKYDDIDILISVSSQTAYQIRLFWNGFDSTWDAFSFSRSKRRLNYNINNK